MSRNYLAITSFALLCMILLYVELYTSGWRRRVPLPSNKWLLGIFDERGRFIEDKRTSLKRILVMTTFWGGRPWPYLNQIVDYTQRCGCNFDMCEVTYDVSKFNSSDIVFFHGKDGMPRDLEMLSQQRPVKQLWVYFIMENSFFTPKNIKELDKYFNLTASYRRKSDIYNPYRRHIKLETTSKIEERNYAEGKTRLIGWATSHCGQKRDKLVQKLHEFGLQIDNFGQCKYPFVNSRPFPRGPKAPYNEYKFVFAAESALCEDYITEKYWNNPFDNDANSVPIVLGGANYSDPELAIPGSFIDAMSFSSPRALAEYLKLLDKNDTLYNTYFEWRKYWRFYDVGLPRECNLFMCELCEKLHQDKWKLRKNTLLTTINITSECLKQEMYFDEWVNKV